MENNINQYLREKKLENLSKSDFELNNPACIEERKNFFERKEFEDVELFNLVGSGDNFLEEIKCVLSACPNLIYSKNSIGQTPLVIAIKMRQPQVLDFLINQKVKCNCGNLSEQEVQDLIGILFGVYKERLSGYHDFAQMYDTLMRQNPDVLLNSEDFNIIMFAIRLDNSIMLDALLDFFGVERSTKMSTIVYDDGYCVFDAFLNSRSLDYGMPSKLIGFFEKDLFFKNYYLFDTSVLENNFNAVNFIKNRYSSEDMDEDYNFCVKCCAVLVAN